jgi:DNA-binding response OmpR family regulator
MARILLLEADSLLAQNITKYLSKAGHEVQWFAEPQSAIHAADEQSPELVILDLLLASHSGAEFLYEFRSYPDWQNTPVIIFSSLSNEEIQEAAPALSQLKVSAYFHKPHASLLELSHAVNEALQPVAK